MRRLSIAVIATAAIIAFPHLTSAADLGRQNYKAPPPPSPPVYNWTGWYVGANIGGGWGHRDVTYVPNDPISNFLAIVFNPPLTAASFNSSGIIGGLQLGYNWQFNRNWLLGFEADFNWSGVKGSTSNNSNAGFAVSIPFTAAVDEHIKWFGTVRARLGYLPSDNFLVFIAGGFAYGRVEHSASMTDMNGVFGAAGFGFSFLCSNNSPCFAGSTSDIAAGWTLGGGFEYAFAQRWTFKAEYLYVSLDGTSVTETALTLFGAGTSPASFNANFNRTNFGVARVGLNYRF